jgi:hypothetical protein
MFLDKRFQFCHGGVGQCLFVDAKCKLYVGWTIASSEEPGLKCGFNQVVSPPKVCPVCLRVRHDVSCACKCYGMSLHIALVVHSLLTPEIANRKWFCMQAGYIGKGP